MSRHRIILVTIGIVLSLFLASMEATVVATATPTIVGQLGGLQQYSWVFSAFLLASTTPVLLYGKLSDLYGRRTLYMLAMALFLAGSVWCGQAQTMTQLIMARGLQGIGAGGVMPLAYILLGEMFALEQRATMQGVFAGVWGVSSIVGPLLGGVLVEHLSWRWVFYINVFPGLLAVACVACAWRDQMHSHAKPSVDYAGAGVFMIAVVTLLLGLTLAPGARARVDASGTTIPGMLLAASLVCFLLLCWIESHAVDPILPLHLFRERLFAATIAHGTLAGGALCGSIAFIPLFVQSVLGTSAADRKFKRPFHAAPPAPPAPASPAAGPAAPRAWQAAPRPTGAACSPAARGGARSGRASLLGGLWQVTACWHSRSCHRRAGMLTPVTIYRHHLPVGPCRRLPLRASQGAAVCARTHQGVCPTPWREGARLGCALAWNLHKVGLAVVGARAGAARPLLAGLWGINMRTPLHLLRFSISRRKTYRVDCVSVSPMHAPQPRRREQPKRAA